MPLSYRWMSQLRPCIWYSRILPPVITLGWDCSRGGGAGTAAPGGGSEARNAARGAGEA